jgi:hypothetical protein
METLNKIKEELKKYESDFTFSSSICIDGRVSLYAIYKGGNVKVRMSNHSVLSISRVKEEIHLKSFQMCGSLENAIAEWVSFFNRFYGK